MTDYVTYCADNGAYYPLKSHIPPEHGATFVIRPIEQDKEIRDDLKRLQDLVDEMTEELEKRTGLDRGSW